MGMTNRTLLMYFLKREHMRVGELADEIGISRKSLSSRINGRIDFNQSDIEKICKVLKIKGEDITRVFFSGLKVTKNEHEWDYDYNGATCGDVQH